MDPKRRRYTVFYIYTYNIEKLYVQSFEFIAWYAYAIHIFAVGYVIFYWMVQYLRMTSIFKTYLQLFLPFSLFVISLS